MTLHPKHLGPDIPSAVNSGTNNQGTVGVSRREFFGITAQTSAAFIIGGLFNGKIEAFASTTETKDLPLNAWVRICSDN